MMEHQGLTEPGNCRRDSPGKSHFTETTVFENYSTLGQCIVRKSTVPGLNFVHEIAQAYSSAQVSLCLKACATVPAPVAYSSPLITILLQVGLCTLYTFFAYPHHQRLRLSQLLVLPPYQKQGHGQALLQAVYRLASERQALDVTVSPPPEYCSTSEEYVCV
jgi:ribosomal protein S18 acetylase RimI-like enzyme